MATKRIEYIDAMRGFTMLLVVYAHIQIFSLNITSDVFTFNKIMYLFRMPLFFFISGFILYKSTTKWDMMTTINFLKKKFLIQIIPTTFFIFIFAFCFDYNIYSIFVSEMKYGYWFTYTLLEFFIFYVSIQSFLQAFKLQRFENYFLITAAIFLFVIRSDKFITIFNDDLVKIIGIKHWFYFLYFIIGCLLKKYFNLFQKLIDSKYFLPLIQILFLSSCIYFVNYQGYEKILKIIIALSGIIIVFSFFRKYQSSFTYDTWIGKCFQYIGRRTLDVYLLHYFFLPHNIRVFNSLLIETNPTIEFIISITLSILVIGFCLIASNILRISPIVGHYLFGVKINNTNNNKK